MKKLLLFFVLFALPAQALEGGANTEAIEVRTNFSGATLTIFGALQRNIASKDNIFILVEGPKRTFALWQKKRIAGVWTNVDKKLFSNVSGFYFLAANQSIGKAQRKEVLQNIKSVKEKEIIENLLAQRNLFSAVNGRVELLGKRLFRAQIDLPPYAPIGQYGVRIMHFSANQLLDQVALPLTLNRTGWGQTLFWFAQEWAFFYGLLAVALALLIGWGITELLRRLT
jgi:hypothetical protein